MKKGKILHVGGLKCDNPDCDYRNDDIPFQDYELYLEVPCPKCWEPLLTEADFQFVKRLAKSASRIVHEPLPEEVEKGRARIRYEFNGTGRPRVFLRTSEGAVKGDEE